MNLQIHAIGYALDRGWSVFPTHGVRDDGTCTCGRADCGSIGKHPATPQGLHNATSDERLAGMLFKDGHNIGVRTGEASGFWALDVDGPAGEASLAALEAQHGALPATLVHYTGNGRHLLFRWPGQPVKNSVKRIGDGLDCRGDGGYIVVAPSRHASGVQYRFSDPDADIANAPDWLLALVRKDAVADAPLLEPRKPATYDDQDLTADQVAEMLSFIHPDCDYQTWVEIGMGLHAGGWPVQVWDDWSRNGAKYQAGDCYRRWKGFKPGAVTFGSVWHHAEAGGWSPSLLHAIEVDGPHPAQPFLDKIQADNEASFVQAAPVTAPVPAEPTDKRMAPPPGIIADTVRWVVGSAIKPQPELALLNVVAALGAVFGQRYATEWDTRTNVYIVGIAGTGSGKDHSRKQVKKLLVAAGLHDFLGGDSIVSGPGLLRGLASNPCQIQHLDEFGMLLQAITAERGDAHKRAAGKAFVEIFSSSSSIYHGGNYASADIKPIIIDKPNLCIYGTSTLETYVKALTRSAIASGELNRFLVLPGRENPGRVRKPIGHEPPERLVREWASLKDHHAAGQGNLQALGGAGIAAPTPTVLRWDDVADRLDDMGDYEDDRARAHKREGKAGVWTRYREQVIKLAMISAIARNPVVPVMTDADLDFAEALVRESCEYVVGLARDHIADSQQERSVNAVLEVIRQGGGEWVAASQVARQTRSIQARDREAILTDLVNVLCVVEAGKVAPSGRGRPAACYRYVG